jgi:hypothetical protein
VNCPVQTIDFHCLHWIGMCYLVPICLINRRSMCCSADMHTQQFAGNDVTPIAQSKPIYL